MLKLIDELLENYKYQMYADLEEIVNLNSFSANRAGLDNVLKSLIAIGKDKDINLETVYSSKNDRPHLMYGKNKYKNYYALIGHFDTVHSPNSDFKVYKDDGEIIKGPGTNDMKAGLIVAIYSLSILKKLYPNRDLPFKILFNSDEEIGSIDSKEIIQAEFIGAKAAFIFEPGRSNGEIVTRRKGIGTLDIDVIGKAAHSGVAPWDGINSLLASCDIIKKLEALNDYKKGIIVGCNQLNSGVARNVVPAYSKIFVDIRFEAMIQKETLFKNIQDILNEKNSYGVQIKYKLELNRPPLEISKESIKISQLYKETSKNLGYDCEELSTGGGSDGNFLSSMGIPTIDGLGAVGDFSHTKKEYTKKDSLIYRTKIFVLFMIKLLEKN
jgi:glutamate carboxypeptidase